MRRVGAYVGDDWFGAARQAVANRAGHQLGRGKRRRANDNHGSIVAFAFQYGPDCAAQQIWLQTRKRHINGIAIQRSEIGRASCRERVCTYVEISVVAVSLKKKYTLTKTTRRVIYKT